MGLTLYNQNWVAERNLAQHLVAAFCQPSRLRQVAAQNLPEAVERAIARLERGERDMAEEIRDLLG
jgi:hypothetical protein